MWPLTANILDPIRLSIVCEVRTPRARRKGAAMRIAMARPPRSPATHAMVPQARGREVQVHARGLGSRERAPRPHLPDPRSRLRLRVEPGPSGPGPGPIRAILARDPSGHR